MTSNEVDFKIPLAPFFKVGNGRKRADRLRYREDGAARHNLLFTKPSKRAWSWCLTISYAKFSSIDISNEKANTRGTDGWLNSRISMTRAGCAWWT
jgi:hypothetical protein